MDQDADFVAFAEACQLRMLRSAYLICGDRHLAEDLLQSALVKLAMHWRHVRHGQPEAYLRTILYRDAISWRRRHRRETTVESPPQRFPMVDPNESTPARLIFAAALAKLAPRQRAVLVLRFFEDFTEARTAELLGISVGTVKSQTSVALKRLRTIAPELGSLVRVDGEGAES